MEKELKAQIKAFLKDRQMSKNKLAKLAGIEPASLNRFLANQRGVSLRTAEKIERAMK